MMKSILKMLIFAALVAMLAAGLAGCGSDNDSAATPTPTPDPDPVATGPVLTVKDTSGSAVAGATVFAIPVADVEALSAQPLTLSAGNYSAEALAADEPLEDLINGNFTPTGSGVATYIQGVTDADGKAQLVDLPTGTDDKFFIFVQPASADTHLPGGSLCREAVSGASLDGVETAVELSTKPSAAATFVGSSTCLLCHAEKTDITKTAHKLGFMAPGAPSALQNTEKFDADDGVYDLGAALAKYGPGDSTSGGTTVWFYDYDSSRKFDKFKTLESDPGAGATIYATVRVYQDTTDSKYYAQFTNVINPADPNNGMIQEVVLTYGGAVYKQRPMTTIDDSIFMVPLQYNARGDDASADRTKKIWRDYHLDWWVASIDTTAGAETMTLKSKPAANKSVDVQCAPCHFNGYSLTTIDGYYQATGVADPGGETHPATGVKQELNLGCETCHGPGSEHVAAAGQGKFIVTPQNITPERENMLCGQCHSRVVGNGTEKNDSPLNAQDKMMVAGTSRADFLAEHTTRNDANTGDFWGDGLHSKSHHQQYTDFIQTPKYRNGAELLTCASCHNIHGPGTDRHQLSGIADSSLCATCHAEVVIADHQVAKTGFNMGASTQCIDCHATKTAFSGAGTNPTTAKTGGTSGKVFYHGDITSHRFDVPLKTESSTGMPVPYTNNCGLCHNLSGL
jgi:hypothetical protein